MSDNRQRPASGSCRSWSRRCKNEITAHGIAVLTFEPDVRTIIEVGGQDSKIIILRDGVVSDFAMNTVCAAGTGSFLDRQAARLNIPIEQFGELALKSRSPVRIAGRCAVFAESDMIHKQQMGCSCEDIVRGLCEALVRNYLNNIGKGKEILPKVVFQGGVAANVGIRKAFEEALGFPITVPEHYDVMGAIGAAILSKKFIGNNRSRFKGFDMVLKQEFQSRSFECGGCPNICEIIQLNMDGGTVALWGGRCGRWAKAQEYAGEKRWLKRWFKILMHLNIPTVKRNNKKDIEYMGGYLKWNTMIRPVWSRKDT